MNNVFRISISCVAAIIVAVIGSIIIVSIGANGTFAYIINAAVAVSLGKGLNSFLKKKYPPKNPNSGSDSGKN